MSKYESAKENFRVGSYIAIDEEKGYESTALPIIESNGALKTQAQISEICQIKLSDVSRHLGGTYTYREQMQRHLTTICEFLQGDSLLPGKKMLIIDKLQEGAINCTPGFMNRIQDCILGLKRPQTMAQLLALYRRGLVEMARAPASNEVHANQRFLSEANAMGLAIPDEGVKDVYTGALSKQVVQQHIKAVFQEKYTPAMIEREVFSSVFAGSGYCGKKSTSDSYGLKVVGPILELFKQLVEEDSVTHEELFIWEENAEGYEVIVDINMDFVAAQVRDYLLRTGCFVKRTADQKLIFSFENVSLCVNPKNVDQSVFRVKNGDAEQYFFIEDAHDFAGDIPASFFQGLLADQQLESATKSRFLVMSYLQGLAVGVDLVKNLLTDYFAQELESAKCVERAIQHMDSKGRKVCIESMLPIFPKLKDSIFSLYSKAALVAYLAELDPTLQSSRVKEAVLAVTKEFSRFKFTAVDISLDLYRVYLSSLKDAILSWLKYDFELYYCFNAIGFEKSALFLDELGVAAFDVIKDKKQYLDLFDKLEGDLKSLFLARSRSILSQFNFNQSEVVKLVSFAIKQCHGAALNQMLCSLITSKDQLKSLLPILDIPAGSAVLQALLPHWNEKVGGAEETLSILSALDAQISTHLYPLLESKLCEQITGVQTFVRLASSVDDSCMERMLRLVMGRLSGLVHSSQDFFSLLECLNEKSQLAALIVLLEDPASFIGQLSEVAKALQVLKGPVKALFCKGLRARLHDVFVDEGDYLLAVNMLEMEDMEVDIPDSFKNNLDHASTSVWGLRCYLKSMSAKQKTYALHYIRDKVPGLVGEGYEAKHLLLDSVLQSCHLRQILLYSPEDMVSQVVDLGADDFVCFWHRIKADLRKDFLHLISQNQRWRIFNRLSALNFADLLKGCDADLAQNLLDSAANNLGGFLRRISSYCCILGSLPRELWGGFSRSAQKHLEKLSCSAFYWGQELKNLDPVMMRQVFLTVPEAILSSIKSVSDFVALADIIGLEQILSLEDKALRTLRKCIKNASNFKLLVGHWKKDSTGAVGKILCLLMSDIPGYVRSASDVGVLLNNLNEKQGLSVLIVLMASPQSFIYNLDDLRVVYRALSALQQRYFCRVIESRLLGLFQGWELLEARRYLGLSVSEVSEVVPVGRNDGLTGRQCALLDQVASVDQLLAVLAQVLYADKKYVIAYLNTKIINIVRAQDDLFRLLDFLGKKASSAVFLHSANLVRSFLFSTDYAGFYGLFQRASPYWQEWMIVTIGDSLINKLVVAPIDSLNELLAVCDSDLVRLILQQLNVSGDLSHIVSTPEQVFSLTAAMIDSKAQAFYAALQQSPGVLQKLAAAKSEGRAGVVVKAAKSCLALGSAPGMLYQSINSGIAQMIRKEKELQSAKERRLRHIKLAAGRATTGSFLRDLAHFNQKGERLVYIQALGRSGLKEMLDSKWVSRNHALCSYRAEFLAAYIAIREAEAGKHLLTTHLSAIFSFLLPDKKKKVKIARSLLDQSCRRTYSGGLLGLIDSTTRSPGVRC